MSNTKYSKDHEWIVVDGDTGTVGITEYAQDQLGDVVFVELPDIGREVNKGEDFAVVESVKAASEIYAPVGGEVVEANEALNDNPALINESAMGDGWIAKIKLSNPGELGDLMDEAAYKQMLEELD
jgi:glycine cleavage system H protein